MSSTEEEIIAEERRKRAERQWIENYKKYARLIDKAKAEMSVE